MMKNPEDSAEQIYRHAEEVKSAVIGLHGAPQPNQIMDLKGELLGAINTLETAKSTPVTTDDSRKNKISEARNTVMEKIDQIVQEIDKFNRMVKKVTDTTRTLSTIANRLKSDVDPSDDAKKQTETDKKNMLVEARNALRKGILTEKFSDLKAGVTPRDFADVTYVYLSQSWRAYNTDDAMNSALVAAMMISTTDMSRSPDIQAGDVYQPYLMDTPEHRRAIMRFMGEQDHAGNAAVDQVDMQWREHFTSSAAEEAQRGADEIRQLKIRLADTEAKLRNVQNNVFDLAMELAAKMQNALAPVQKKN
jgi:hypothetical protein